MESQADTTLGSVETISFLNLTKSERLDIIKTKEDTVTCSQALKKSSN